MIYMIGLAAMVAVLGLLPDQYGLRQKNHKSYLILCCIIITLIIGLRSVYVGSSDTWTYAYRFKSMLKYDTFSQYYDTNLADKSLWVSESGFYWFLWLLSRLTEDYQWLIFITSAFTTTAACLFIYRNSSDGFMSLLIYVCLGLFTFNLNGMRQAMAMSICLFAFEHAKKRNLLRFIFLVLLAMQFHKTAICFFPVFILPMLNYSKSNLAMYVCGMLVFLLLLDNIVMVYNDLSGEEYDATDSSTGGGLFVILIYLFALIIAIIQPDTMKDRKACIACFAVVAGLAAYLGRFFSNQMMERISYYYFYFVILLIPASFEKLNTNESKVIRWLFIAFALALYAYRIYSSSLRDFKFYF